MISFEMHWWEFIVRWAHAVAFVGGATAIFMLLAFDPWGSRRALRRRLDALEQHEREVD